MNDPSEFLKQVAAKDAKAAIAHPGDIRSAIHAIMTLDAFHASLYQSGTIREQNDSKWKEELACKNKYYRMSRDYAYALKHGELWHEKPRLFRRPEQIVSKGRAFQASAFQTNRIWITAEDGDYRADLVIKNVAEFARQCLQKAAK